MLDFQLPKRFQIDYSKLLINNKDDTNKALKKFKFTLKRILTEIVDMQSSNAYNINGVSLKRILLVEEEVTCSFHHRNKPSYNTIADYCFRFDTLFRSSHNYRMSFRRTISNPSMSKC